MDKQKKTDIKRASVDKPISIVCIALILAFVVMVITKPDATLNTVSVIFDYATAVFGVPILWFVFIGLFICLYLAFGKYGNIKLGDGEPEYSMFSYIAMMMCAALAATAVYYSFIEWSFYLSDPAFGIEPYSREAAEFSLAYAFFHWGFAVQVIFVLIGVCMAYGFYVKKIPHLRVSAVCEEMMGDFRYKKILGRIIDALTILSVIGGVGVVSMGVGVPIISAAISKIFGVEATFAVNLIVLLIVAAVFTFTSFMGVRKGMKRLSDMTLYLAIAIMTFILIFGPTKFIVKNFTYSCGKMLSNYVDMSLFTDPIGNSGFPEINTIFLFTLAFNYAALMGIFIAKISKGMDHQITGAQLSGRHKRRDMDHVRYQRQLRSQCRTYWTVRTVKDGKHAGRSDGSAGDSSAGQGGASCSVRPGDHRVPGNVTGFGIICYCHSRLEVS